MTHPASLIAAELLRPDAPPAGLRIPALLREVAGAYSTSVSELTAGSEQDEFWNAMASNIAAGWLDDMLALRAPVVFDSQLDAMQSGAPRPANERELAQQDKERLIESERHVSNLMVLQFLGTRLSAAGPFETRISQLPNSLRHVPLAPHLEAQIRSATALYLLGLERECVVFCAAAVEAALESHNGNQPQPLEEGRKGGKTFIVRCINQYLPATPLNYDCHSLRETRNEHLHPISRPPQYRRLSALESLVVLVLVLEQLAPPPEDPREVFERMGKDPSA